MLRETTVENGKLRGLPAADPRVTAFRGVPFAAPPVGERRWRAPSPCPDWEGTREAYGFGPIPMQDTPGLGDDIYCREWHVDPEIPMSEDCLYLNIWTNAKDGREKMPVLLWYFGGGFQWGYTAEMEFDGERLARRGIVVVTAAYRLGAFGFLAHPDLTREDPEAPSNFGLLDQQAALMWVHRNIAAFGGDPENITIAGQSAGGGSVMNQLVCEENRLLIRGAAVFSGMIRNRAEDSPFSPLPLEEAERGGEAFLSYLGAEDIAAARALPAGEICAKYSAYAQDHPRMFPNLDGQFVRGDALERFIRGECAPVPLLAGNTSDEFCFGGVSIVEQTVKETFLEARENGRVQKDFYYRFDPDIPGDDHPGTFHSCDLWFFFETLAKCSRPYRGRHYDLARQMCDYFANFIRFHDPNGDGSDGERLPAWEPYRKEDLFEMEFTPSGAKPRRQGGLRLGMTGRLQAVNPYLPPWEHVPDGEPYVFDGRIYVYGSHDRPGGETFCLEDYVCWSAPVEDPGNWHYEGVIYRKTQDPANRDGRMCLYAPDVTVGSDGRYYLYYVLDQLNIVSVAVCGRPAGHFEFLGYVHYPDGTRLGERAGDEPQFDPGVLTEGDTTYLYTGFCGHGDKSRHGAMLTLLDGDMLTVRREPEIVVPGSCFSEGTSFGGHGFFEASSIRKMDGKYYFIYSSEVMHELCWAVSDSPMGPFAYGGVLVSNCDRGIASGKAPELAMAAGANNHGSMVQIGDDWYVFYHRHTGGTWYSRQGCAEKLMIRDGKIEQAEMTSCGLNNGPLCDIGEYPAYIACHLFTPEHAVYVRPDLPMVTEDGEKGPGAESCLTGLTDGSCAGFRYFRMENARGLRIKTRGYFRGTVEVRTAWDGPAIGSIDVDHSNVWTARECAFAPLSGTCALYLVVKGSGRMSLRSFEFLH